jgi:8-amino-7-oxononanoate synthase
MAKLESKAETDPHAPLELVAAGELADLARRGLSRFLRQIETAQEPTVRIDGRELLLLCSNNYLGLANHPEVIASSRAALERYGASSVSSRLISGHMTPHAELERELARWKGCAAALVFSTGYQANIGVITSLAAQGDVIVSDALNHASIIDGCRLSRATTAVYRHNDLEHLEALLREHRSARRILVVTEAVFSMDGDRAPLVEIATVAKRYGAWLVVDEAHSAGIFGPRGAGLAAELGLTETIDVHVGTLGKALGSFGAYVAGSHALIDLLINRARSFIFTTGLPPAAAAAATAAINVVEREPWRSRDLLARAQRFGSELRAARLEVPHLDSQIVPVILGSAERAMAVAGRLLARDVYVAAIRPPTVPQGTSRLRVSLMATHTPVQLARAVEAIRSAVGAEA